ncbi:C-C motif chemokine 19-like [Falco biarmicus]|uniref:C-C motif chemokine 19 n=1 Tax=Falco cherrug TaxID=345164 RepID=UPI0003871724|nr:C-C motif chemokine 19 [Falco cherrug]XP_037229711.1 C-C motif chemokine 19 [Falco rusticolus]XP_040435986.1 C-C motif chemokine 19 [Falco naumanni]XP_056180631.1 C-C motif chemokine 19-like [Falco biarmicus]
MQRLYLLCFCLLVLGRILDVHGGNNVLDCCLRTSEKPIPRRIVQDYRLQLVQDGCNIPAAVFITTKGKRLCAPLEAPWVVRLQEKLDASSARKAKPKGK